MVDSKYIESKSFEGFLYLTAGRNLRDRTYGGFWCIDRSDLLEARGMRGLPVIAITVLCLPEGSLPRRGYRQDGKQRG